MQEEKQTLRPIQQYFTKYGLMTEHAIFQGKQPAMEEAPCEVCKVICLTDKEYAFFKKHLMYEYDFLRKNAERMGFHNGIRQCVLVMGENSESPSQE